MLFIDLDTLKIVKEYRYHTVGGTLSINPEDPLKDIQSAVNHLLDTILVDLPNYIYLFEFTIQPAQELAEDEAANFLVTCANIVVGVLVNRLCTANNRTREHRLDVPENLKCAKMSMSALKKLINSKTMIDRLNVRINLQNLVYILCDNKDVESRESEFEYAQ